MQNESVPRNWQVPFFSIWTGQAFSLLGSRVVQFALVWWLTQLTGSATVLAMASMLAILPEIVLGPLAGVYVDRWNRRLVMIVADSLVALASLWLAYMFWIGATQVWHVYLIMVVRAVGGSFHWPAMQASTSLLVPKEHLTRVAGLNQTLHGALSIVGPPLGALLMALLPLQGVMLVDVSTAALAIVPLCLVPIPQPARADDEEKPSVWADMGAGLRYIRGWPGLVALIAAAMVLKIALTPAMSLLSLLVSEHFGGGAAQLSLLEAVTGVGIVVGGLGLSVWGGFQRKIFTTIAGMFGLGVGLLGLGVIPGDMFGMALVSGFALGFMVPMVDGPIMAIMQGVVTPEMQGRVFTMMGSLLWLTSPFSLALAGPISDWLGLQMWYLVAGVMSVGTALVMFNLPAIVHIEENANGAAPSTDTLTITQAEAKA